MQSYNRASGYSSPFLLYLLVALLFFSLTINVYLWNKKNFFQLRYEQEEHLQDSYQKVENKTMQNQLIDCQTEQKRKDSLLHHKDSILEHWDGQHMLKK